MKKTDKKKHRAHPWRDNIEAITVSIITIVLFKYFVLEAYKIPTGSMQPTLMGNEETGIFDRVIVDKFSYHYRDPERFEIVVFRYPLDLSKNFIKRIVGMPGERLFIDSGDVWVQGKDDAEPHVLRRPRRIQDAQLRLLDTENEWRFESNADWTIDGNDILASGAGSARFPRTATSIRDGYTDGYPEEMKSKINTRAKRSNYNEVSDLRVAAKVRADDGCSEVVFELREGDRRFRFALPGPAASETARPRIDAKDYGRGDNGTNGDSPDESMPELSTEASEPWRLTAGDATKVTVQNLDDLLQLRIAGGPDLSLEVPPAREERASSVTLETQGGGARFGGVKVWRDIFYTTAGQRRTEWQIPDDSYVMLGDNSQDSSDARDWSLTGFMVVQGDHKGGIIRGNDRQTLNPRYVPQPDGPPRIFFHDELGERHVFDSDEVERLENVDAALVPRSMIRGRAVLVVWPLAPSLNVYRIKWVR